MSEELAQAVREALERVPCSDRALALKAGVSQSTVYRIRTGERGCSPAVAEALADALEAWAGDYREAATGLRRTLEEREESNG